MWVQSTAIFCCDACSIPPYLIQFAALLLLFRVCAWGNITSHIAYLIDNYTQVVKNTRVLYQLVSTKDVKKSSFVSITHLPM